MLITVRSIVAMTRGLQRQLTGDCPLFELRLTFWAVSHIMTTDARYGCPCSAVSNLSAEPGANGVTETRSHGEEVDD